jgi:integrase/recombinase XerD
MAEKTGGLGVLGLDVPLRESDESHRPIRAEEKQRMKRRDRGMGEIFQATYKDPKTSELKKVETWSIRYFVNGARFKESTGSINRADAVRLLKKRIGQAANGKPLLGLIRPLGFEDLATMVTADYKANQRRSLARVEDALNHLRGFFGKDKADRITTDRLIAYRVFRCGNETDGGEGASHSTVNREFAALRRAFHLAAQAGKAANIPHFPTTREDNHRKGFFEPKVFQAVLDELPDYLKSGIQTAYVTGWRGPSEIFTRQRHHVDLDAGWLRLDPGETKNGKGRMFPLTPELQKVLENQIALTEALEKKAGVKIPWLFHNKGKPIRNYYSAWRSACDRAAAKGRMVHDFRRTAVRNFERAGISRSDGMAMSGHLTNAVYSNYAIVDETSLKESEAKLAKLHAGEDRKYAMTPAQIERLSKMAAINANRPSTGPMAADAGK